MPQFWLQLMLAVTTPVYVHSHKTTTGYKEERGHGRAGAGAKRGAKTPSLTSERWRIKRRQRRDRRTHGVTGTLSFWAQTCLTMQQNLIVKLASCSMPLTARLSANSWVRLPESTITLIIAAQGQVGPRRSRTARNRSRNKRRSRSDRSRRGVH